MQRLIGVAVSVLLLGACASPGPSLVATGGPPVTPGATATSVASSPAAVSPSPSPSPSEESSSTSVEDLRVSGWRADIAQLVEGIESRHPDLEKQIAPANLERAAAALGDHVATLTNEELLFGVMRLVALVSQKGCDAHTGAYVWGGGSYPVDSLPLRLWLFGDELYVVDALPPYQELIGQSVQEIAGTPIEAVRSLIEPIVPRDNDQTVRLLLPRFLLIPQVLRGVGLPVDSTVRLQTQNLDGTHAETHITPIPMSDYNAWAGAYGLHLPADSAVPYLSRINDIIWSRKLSDGSLYVQYNRVEPTPLNDLDAALGDASVRKVVLDLRHNFGGEVFVMDQVTGLFSDWLAMSQDHHLELVTGRNTFSAGSLLVAKLAEIQGVDVAGEPMGGCPTGWGNNRDFALDYSGIPISVSTTFEVGVSANDTRPTIEPNQPAELTIQDWMAKRDPVLP